jgi:hypothetical protein
VTVTDQQDETGRIGIRRAEITMMKEGSYQSHLEDRMAAYSPAIRHEADRIMTLGRWLRVLEQAVPKMGIRDQVLLARPYRDPEGWAVMEYLVIYLATRWAVRAMRGWPAVIPFTTLALETREAGRIVALPLEHTERIGLRNTVHVP